jgi:tetratricopeptide (TPR) repeat protein
VVKELRTTLLGETPDSDASGEAKAEVAKAAVGRGANPEAHRLYLQAIYFIDRFTEEGVVKGMAYLQEALSLDPNNALAWAALARGYNQQAAYGWRNAQEAAALAKKAAEKALSLVPDLPEVHLVLSAIQAYYDRDWRAAGLSLQRALELAPASSPILLGAGQYALFRARYEEAEHYTLRALEQDPLSSRAYSQLGTIYRVLGRYLEAERAYRKSLELSPQRITAHQLLALVLVERGEFESAIAEANLEPAVWGRLTALGWAYWRAGRRAEADEALARLEADFAKDTAFQIAALYAIRGNVDASFAWLERGFEQYDAGLNLLVCEPSFRPLHGDPRWMPFLRKLGLAD